MELFSSNGRQEDPRNHCVPLLETLVDDCDEEHCFIVMPLLRSFGSPDFESVDEVIDFVHQALEVDGLLTTCVQLKEAHVHAYRDWFTCITRMLLIGRSRLFRFGTF